MANAGHEKKVRDAELAIDRVNNDTTVPKEDTARSLKALRDHIDILLDALGDE